MTTTTNKGITHGWNSGDAGWGADMNENLRRLDAYVLAAPVFVACAWVFGT